MTDANDHRPLSPPTSELSRRRFLGSLGVAVAASIIPGCGGEKSATRPGMPAGAEPLAAQGEPEELLELTLTVNKKPVTMQIDPRVTLLDLLRERMNLMGTKKGCDHGQCGACTILVNGRTINSCLTLAALHPNADVTTIEGLSDDAGLHAVQTAFLKHDAFQCGYCTPGQIMSAASLVALGKRKTAAEIREYMSGNICRCGAYPNIVAAVTEAQGGPPSGKEGAA